MSYEIKMPALSPTMTEGVLSKWLVKIGDEVRSGDVIAEIETDKATMEVETVEDGIVTKLVIDEGTLAIPVGTVIATISVDNGDEPKEIGKDDSDAEETADMLRDEEQEIQSAVIKKQEAKSLSPNTNWDGAVINMTVREALRDAMAEEMRGDDKIFIMGEEVAEYQGAYKVTQGLLEEFGERRIIDTPITEHGFTGLAVGAAFGDLRPIVEFMTFNFSMQAIDQIINSAAKTLYMSGGQMGCPIVFRGPNGAASRVAAQHSQCFASWYAHCPGLKVISPWSSADAKGLLKSAIRDPNPVIFLENEVMYGQSFDVPDTDDWIVPIGKGNVVKQGKDVTITAFSVMVGKALEAAEELNKKGIAAEVIDLRTLRPLDIDLIIQSVKKTNRLVSCEEGFPFAGIGAELGMQVNEKAFDYLDSPIMRVTGKDVPMPYAANLEALTLPQSDDIVQAALKACYMEEDI